MRMRTCPTTVKGFALRKDDYTLYIYSYIQAKKGRLLTLVQVKEEGPVCRAVQTIHPASSWKNRFTIALLRICLQTHVTNYLKRWKKMWRIPTCPGHRWGTDRPPADRQQWSGRPTRPAAGWWGHACVVAPSSGRAAYQLQLVQLITNSIPRGDSNAGWRKQHQ